MEITKIASLTDEENTILKNAGTLGRTILSAFDDNTITKVDESNINLIKAVIEVLTKVVDR